MAQGHRFKSEVAVRGSVGRAPTAFGSIGRFAKPSRNGHHLRIPVED